MRADKISMAVATFARLGSGLILFTITARFLGPSQFGVFAGAMAYALLFNLLTDFGLGTYGLRLAGIEPERTVEILRRAILVKSAVTFSGILLVVVLFLISPPDPLTMKVQILVFAAMTMASYADLAFVAARAKGRFDIERTCVGWTSVVLLAIVCLAALTGDIVITTWAFFAGRVIYIGGVVLALREWLFADEPWSFDPTGVWHMARGAFPYAVDGALINLSNQIDVVMVTLMLDPGSTGIYQAGARLVQGISPVAVILSTVYLPQLSKAHYTREFQEFRRLARTLNFEFAGLAVAGFLGFLLLGPLWTTHVYGDKYDRLLDLWPAFALYAGSRFLAASFGVQLVALNEIHTRIFGQLTTLFALVGVFVFLSSQMTPKLAAETTAGINLLLLLIYAMRALFLQRRLEGRPPSDK